MPLTSQIRYVTAIDTSAADGSGKTGLTYSDITAKYVVQGGTIASLTTETITTLGTYQAPTSSAYLRIKELLGSDPTKGVYEVHFHNTQLASGERLWLFLGASGARFTPLEIDLATKPAIDAIPTAAASASAVRTELATELARIDKPISEASNVGPGADSVTITINNQAGDPVADADVWISSDPAGSNVIAGTLQTDSEGTATFLLDAGSHYYLWAQKDGMLSKHGELFTANAD